MKNQMDTDATKHQETSTGRAAGPKSKHLRRLYRAALGVLACLLVAGFLVGLWSYLRPDTWHYYTDEITTRQLAKHAEPQPVVWEPPMIAAGDANIPSDMSEPAFSPGGDRMVFTRGLSAGDANLYLVTWDGFAWGAPQPLRALNSKFNEIGPAFSHDGQYLYFSTDRPGGRGGYDIWVSRWDGSEFAWPMPLTLMVNSRFDELGPASAPGGGRLYFSSNRPRRPLTDEEAALDDKALRDRFQQLDHDIFEAHRVPAGADDREIERATSMLYSLRAAALADKDVMAKLGGSEQSERAVDKALEWLAANQETNGVWRIETLGGKGRHDVASTAFALLSFAGRSELHDRPCTYRETAARGLTWLLSEQNPLTGDLRGKHPPGQAMYDHAIGTLALTEIYGLTKDENLQGPAQDAINFLVDAQNKDDGGWRYKPNDPGDMSVSGWVIMALKSAEMSGLNVPGKTLHGVRQWLQSVSGGTHGGIYGYQGKGGSSPAMIATGYFCSQLMGLSPNTTKAFETAQNLSASSPSVADLYFAYYGTLSAYQNQGPLWRQWQTDLHEALLTSQQADGSWTASGKHSDIMGRGVATALALLSLQAHYRYTPLYGLGYEPATNGIDVSTSNLAGLPGMPLYRRARRMDSVSSPGQDVHPAVTGHGDFLFFASDREGGQGGLDIYRTRITGEEPTPPANLGRAVNSRSDDTAPALRMGGFHLLFASNRGQSGESLFQWYQSMSRPVFRRLDADEADVRLVLWETPAPLIGSFNLPTNDIAPQFLPDGASMVFEQGRPGTAGAEKVVSRWDGRRWSDPVAYVPPGEDAETAPLPLRDGGYVYSASAGDGGLGGLDIYRSRRVNGAYLQKENLGLQINSPADDRLPQTRWEGFDLLFVSNREQDDPAHALLYSSTAREVVGRVDYSRWYQFVNLFNRVKWWIVAGLAALGLLIYLLRQWRRLDSLFHRCLMGSIMAHLLVAFLMSIWFISAELMESAEPKSMEVSIDADALAREKLALDMNEAVAELPASDVPVVIERVEALPMPEFTPPAPSDAPPVVTQTSDASFVTRVTPSRASEDMAPSALAAAVVKMPEIDMPALDMPALEVALEEPEPVPSDQPLEPGDPKEMAVEVKPDDVQQPVVLERVETRPAETTPAGRPREDLAELASNLADLLSTDAPGAATRDTGGSLIVASAGMESQGALPKLAGEGDLAALLIASPLDGRELKMKQPGKLDIPKGLGDVISTETLKIAGRPSIEIVKDLGGSAETEAAIGRALDWFSKNQESDGRWDIVKHGGQEGHDVAATSLILLCYYGWGAQHNQAGPYQETVSKAIDWLLKQMGKDEDGNLNGDYCTGHGIHGMYDQGMATIVLCEAYALSGDKRLLEPAIKAVDFIVKAQDPRGGWRYQPRSGADTSVFGWQYMALRSAQLAGIPVPDGTLEKADTWLDQVGGGQQGGIYGYQGPGETPSPALVGTGMFARQLAGMPPHLPKMQEGARYMQAHPIKADSVDWYYLYYGTLALYQHQGKIWEEWNARMKETLTSLQHKTGASAGSWDPSGSHGSRMGRAVVTAMGTLSLEVYYRILPVYGFRPVTEE